MRPSPDEAVMPLTTQRAGQAVPGRRYIASLRYSM
jgi:hypothetical protein